MKKKTCRFCGNDLKHTFVDLGVMPLANSYIPENKVEKGEMVYPLHLHVCEKCFLVQTDVMETPENIFGDYAYFSSFSTSWLEHSSQYADFMISAYGIGPHSKVVEVASNDGYLLQYFKEKGVPVLGIEPAANVAEVARKERGIPTDCEFFTSALATNMRTGGTCANLLIAHNVLQHVPDINDFVEGLRILLDQDGVLTLQFHYLLSLMQKNEFDTIYHEHVSYLSFMTVKRILEVHGLHAFDVEEFPDHGGSIRIYVCHDRNSRFRTTERIDGTLRKEKDAGLDQLGTYLNFGKRANKIKRDLLEILIGLRRSGKSIAAYGAAAKGNTLLNYCGIRQDFIDFVVDRSPHKQGTYLPGSRIPVHHPNKLREVRPDYILVLPWNLKDEIIGQLSDIRASGTKFIIPIPEVKVLE